MGKKQITFIITLIILLNFVFISGCIQEKEKDNKTSTKIKGEFYVHEWGVFVKGYDCNDTSVKTYQPELLHVLKPVIYFHSLDDENVKVEVSKIKNATVIPYAETNDNFKESKIIWDVEVKNDTIYGYSSSDRTNELNKYDYLFYEGNINCPTNIIVNITSNPNNNTYTIQNNELFNISTVFVIKGDMNDYLSTDDDKLECVFFEDLNPGSKKTIVNTSSEKIYNATQAKIIIKNKLLKLNLTINESNALLNYWDEWFFYPQNYGQYTRVIYFIPQTVYDSLLPIEIDPEPKDIIRAGIFVISDIPIYTPPSYEEHGWVYITTLGTGSFTIYYYDETIDISDVRITVTNPNDEVDVIENPANNTLINLNNGVFKWIDETGDEKIGDNDEINIYSNYGLITGTWNVKISNKSTSELIYDTNVTIE